MKIEMLIKFFIGKCERQESTVSNISNEVFESVDELSSRTVSVDKISTITEV